MYLLAHAGCLTLMETPFLNIVIETEMLTNWHCDIHDEGPVLYQFIAKHITIRKLRMRGLVMGCRVFYCHVTSLNIAQVSCDQKTLCP